MTKGRVVLDERIRYASAVDLLNIGKVLCKRQNLILPITRKH